MHIPVMISVGMHSIVKIDEQYTMLYIFQFTSHDDAYSAHRNRKMAEVAMIPETA
jgi:hypothetical protein